MFEDFFRLHAKGADGRTVIMHEVAVEYELRNGPLDSQAGQDAKRLISARAGQELGGIQN